MQLEVCYSVCVYVCVWEREKEAMKDPVRIEGTLFKKKLMELRLSIEPADYSWSIDLLLYIVSTAYKNYK